MKKTKNLALAFFAMLTLSLVFVSCSKGEETDLVNDISMRVNPSDGLIKLNNQLQDAGSPAEMAEIIGDNQWLTGRVVSYARELEIIKQNAKVDSVVFYYGSAEAQAQDKTGKYFDGKVTDQLVAFIFHDGIKNDPAGVIVLCTNGMLADLNDFTRITSGDIEFTIEDRQGINTYVDYETAINLAERFDLDLYRGKNMSKKNKITPATARSLQSSIDRIQVTVKVYAGDHFDLGSMTYTPAPR